MRQYTSDYQQVFDTIQAHTGLRVLNGRFDETMRVVDEVLASKDLTGVHDLLFALQSSTFTDSLWQKFVQTLTVGETYFFRDQGQFDALRSYILPQLIDERHKTGSRHLRLWSAGCASGEEPYSLAMLLHEVVPDIETWNITILGTDINLAFLERARRGLYRASSFRNETPKHIQKRWFKHTTEGYQLDHTIRDMVVFSPLNLADTSEPLSPKMVTTMDLIVCRNVTIYFDQATVHEIIGRFYHALNELGRLIVGHSELSTTMYRDFFTRSHEKVVFYQKVTAPKDTQAPSPITAQSVKRQTSIGPTAPPPTATKMEPKSPAIIEETQDRSLEEVWAKAKAAADHERWDEALDILAQVEAQYLFRPEFHYLRGLVQLVIENHDEALWAWRQALYCDPEFALAHYSLGDLYEQRGDIKLAVRHWRQALEAVSNMAPQYRLLFSEDITAEMLRGLLAYRVDSLLNGQTGKQR